MSSQSSLYVSQWWRFPLINISWWNRSSLSEIRFGRKMSPAWLNSTSLRGQAAELVARAERPARYIRALPSS